MRVVSLLLLLSFGQGVSAQLDASFTTDFCQRDSDACRALAVEIVRLDLIDEIEEREPPVSGGSLLCRQEAREACCPEGSEEVCEQLEANLIAEGQFVVRRAKLEDCPFSASVCETIEAGSCERDEVYLPWSGCTVRPTIEIPPDYIPPACPQGTKWNGKICLPTPCYTYRLGIRIPCTVFDELANEAVATSVVLSNPAERQAHPLVRFVEDDDVRAAAIQSLREELQFALRALDQVSAE